MRSHRNYMPCRVDLVALRMVKDSKPDDSARESCGKVTGRTFFALSHAEARHENRT